MQKKNLLILGVSIILGVFLAFCLTNVAAMLIAPSEPSNVGYVLAKNSKKAPSVVAVRKEYSFMTLTKTMIKDHVNGYNNAPKAEARWPAPEKKTKDVEGATSINLLPNLNYNAEERDQGYCGDCWLWAGTGVMEIALYKQKNVSDRLSVQYMQSKYFLGTGYGYTCCGGTLTSVANFYKTNKNAIPWANTNANYQDYYKKCGGSANVSYSKISTTPKYPITFIQDYTITTSGVPQATAISNIKNILNNHQGVYFEFYGPTKSDGAAFLDFWDNKSESDVWNPSYMCGHAWESGYGWGHAVLITGYDDADASWTVLNSWGRTTKRPNGLFKLSMSMNYGCTYAYGSDNYPMFMFQTLDIRYTTTTTLKTTTTTKYTTTSTTKYTTTSTTKATTTTAPSTTIPVTTSTLNATTTSISAATTTTGATTTTTEANMTTSTNQETTTTEASSTTQNTTTTTTTTTIAPSPTTTSQTTSTTMQTPCWKASYVYLIRDVNQGKKFCKCASGTYGLVTYVNVGTKTVYKYASSQDNNIWTASSQLSTAAVNKVKCSNGVFYDTNKDYY